MASDYAAIETDNIRRRGEEFDDIGRFLSQQFYSDQTHFVYELLQNAHDALKRRSLAEPDHTFPKSVSPGFNLTGEIERGRMYRSITKCSSPE